MRSIRISADYECYPLWEANPGIVGNINPADLPISPELIDQLMSWANTFDKTLNMDDPVNSGFQNDQEEFSFREEGLILAEKLKNELGEGYLIVLGNTLI